MNHPSHEDLAALLYDEQDAPVRHALQTHLDECPDCRAQMHAWRLVRLRLDGYAVAAGPVRSRSASPLKWSVAASLAFGLGVLSARWLGPAPIDEAALQARVLAKLKAEARAAPGSGESVAATALTAQDWRPAFESFLESYRADRDAHRLALADAVLQIEQRQRDQLFQLRQDLETVALTTSDQLSRTRSHLGQLVAYATLDNPAAPSGVKPSNQE